MKRLSLAFKKVGGHALVITIFVALVLALLCASLIMIGYVNRFWKAAVNKEDKLRRNLQSATNLLLADTLAVVSTQTDSTDLFGGHTDSVVIQRENWGLFTVGYLVAYTPGRTASRLFLYGTEPGMYFDGCLYVAEHQRPVSLNGDVRLSGKAYLPKAGLRPAYINQRGYKYDRLVNGAIDTSAGDLPALNGAFIHHLRDLAAKTHDTAFFNEHSQNMPGDTIRQSFKDSMVVVTRRGNWALGDINWRGHLLLVSDSVITVGALAGLENCILLAPVIIFEPGFSGTVQAIASDSIIVKTGVVLHYPSALVLLKDKNRQGNNMLRLGKNACLEGLLFSYADASDKVNNRVELDSNSLVKGLVYVNGYAELKGAVYGEVLADYFMYKSPAVMYENYLVDMEISRERLSPYFISSPLFGGVKNKIITWLK